MAQLFSANDTYTNIANRFKDWNESSNDDGNVDDVALDVINRAQRSLLMYMQWDGIRKRADLTITNRTASLPSDCNSIIRVYHDTDDNDCPDYNYYNSAVYDNGYQINSVFTLAAGHAHTITFYRDPTETVTVEYWGDLTDFTGSGTEYSFFPPELLLTEAMYIRSINGGMSSSTEFQVISKRRDELLRDYRQSVQFRNNDMRVVQNDDYGEPIENYQYSLNGQSGAVNDRFEPDYDRG